MKPGQLGSTPSGSIWAIKALHPSDSESPHAGLPDESCAPSVILNYQTIARISAPAGLTAPTWSGNFVVTPHPIFFMSGDTFDPISMASTGYGILNSQLSGATVVNKTDTWYSNFQKWRLLDYGVTIVQDGPALADQGTIAVNQTTLPSFMCNGVISRDTIGATTYDALSPHIRYFFNDSVPNYNTVQNMPNAYLGASREGAYIPMKLDKDHMRWMSLEDSSAVSSTLISYDHYTSDFSVMGTNVANVAFGMGLNNETNTGPTQLIFPYAGNCGYSFNWANGKTYGTYLPDLLTNNVANVCFANIAPSTSFSVVIRCGLECQCIPGTLFSPDQVPSPVYDPIALNSYFEISRQLKDCYPARYNSWGMLLDVIKNIGASVVPKMLPYIPKALGYLSNAFGGSIKTVENQVRQRPPKVDRSAKPEVDESGKYVQARPIRVKSNKKNKVKFQKK
jgi:hypothetical protein